MASFDSLNKTVEDLNSEIEEKQKLLKELKAEIKTKEKQLSKDLDKTTAALKSTISDLESKLEENLKNISDLTANISERDATINTMSSEKKVLEEKVNSAEKNQESKMNTIRSQYETKLSALQNELQGVIATREEWESSHGLKLESLRSEVHDAEERANAAEEALAALMKNQADIESNLRASIEDKCSEIVSLETEMTQLKQVNAEKGFIMEKTKKELDDAFNKLDESAQANQNLQLEISKIKSEVEKVTLEKNQIEKSHMVEMEKFKFQVKHEEEKRLEIEKSKKDDAAKSVELEETISKLNVEKKEMSTVLKLKEEELDNALFHVNSLKSEVKKIQTNFENERRKYNEENAQIRKLFDDEKTVLSDELSKLKSELFKMKTLKSQEDEHNADLTSNLEISHQVIAELKAALAKSNSDLEKSEEAMVESQRLANSRLTEVNASQQKARIAQQDALLLSERIKISESLVAKLESELNRIRKSSKENETILRTRLEDLFNQSEDFREKITQLTIDSTKWNHERDEMLRTIQVLQTEVHSRDRQGFNNVERVKMLEKEIIAASRVIKDDREKINHLDLIIVEKDRQIEKMLADSNIAKRNAAKAMEDKAALQQLKKLSLEAQKLKDNVKALQIEKKFLEGNAAATTMEIRTKDSVIEKFRRKVLMLERALNENNIALPIPSSGSMNLPARVGATQILSRQNTYNGGGGDLLVFSPSHLSHKQILTPHGSGASRSGSPENDQGSSNNNNTSLPPVKNISKKFSASSSQIVPPPKVESNFNNKKDNSFNSTKTNPMNLYSNNFNKTQTSEIKDREEDPNQPLFNASSRRDNIVVPHSGIHTSAIKDSQFVSLGRKGRKLLLSTTANSEQVNVTQMDENQIQIHALHAYDEDESNDNHVSEQLASTIDSPAARNSVQLRQNPQDVTANTVNKTQYEKIITNTHVDVDNKSNSIIRPDVGDDTPPQSDFDDDGEEDTNDNNNNNVAQMKNNNDDANESLQQSLHDMGVTDGTEWLIRGSPSKAGGRHRILDKVEEGIEEVEEDAEEDVIINNDGRTRNEDQQINQIPLASHQIQNESSAQIKSEGAAPLIDVNKVSKLPSATSTNKKAQFRQNSSDTSKTIPTSSLKRGGPLTMPAGQNIDVISKRPINSTQQ